MLAKLTHVIVEYDIYYPDDDELKKGLLFDVLIPRQFHSKECIPIGEFAEIALRESLAGGVPFELKRVYQAQYRAIDIPVLIGEYESHYEEENHSLLNPPKRQYDWPE